MINKLKLTYGVDFVDAQGILSANGAFPYQPRVEAAQQPEPWV
jgi:hypothetical protein